MKYLPARFTPTGQQMAAAWALVEAYGEEPDRHCAHCPHRGDGCELDSDNPLECPAYANGMDDPLHRDFYE